MKHYLICPKRVGLRASLIGVAGMCVALAYIGHVRQQYHLEQQAIEQLRSLTSSEFIVLREGETLFCSVGVAAVVRIKHSNPDWLRNLCEWQQMRIFDRVEKVSLRSSEFDNRVIPLLLEFQSLDMLWLSHTSLSESGVEAIRIKRPDVQLLGEYMSQSTRVRYR